MLNLNYNINNSLRNQRNFLKGKVDYRWRRTITTAAGIQSGSIIFGTGSIDFVPFDVETYYISGTYDVGTLSSGSAIGQAVTMKVTGSGVWPTTGSNSMYILIGSSLGFNQNEILLMSAEADDMYLSGSIISSSFFPVLNNEYNIDFGVNHTKGNIYNPLVLWKTMQEEDISGLSVDLPINGYTSSFNIVKNENELLVNVVEVSGSISSSFEYLYNFGVTASLTASINNVTGSTTMSILIPEAGVSTVNRYFNPDTTDVAFTASFVATTDSPYTITGSVEYNKGNLSVADINWRALQTSTTQDLEGDATNLNGVTSSFTLRKDIAQKVLIPNVSGAASVGSYNNENSFNQTASLSQAVNNTTGSVTMSIVVPESGINVTQSWFNPTTTTATLTSSFVAQTITGSYNVTASVINNKGNESNSDINWLLTGSDTDISALISASGDLMIVKDINWSPEILVNVEKSFTSSISSSYQNAYAFNQTASYTSSFKEYYNTDSSSRYWAVSQLSIPEVGTNIWSYETSSILTSSFAATTDSASYNITASTLIYSDVVMDYVLVGGGGGGGAYQAGGGGGAGALLTGSFRILKNTPYQVNIGVGGGPTGNGQLSSFIGEIIPLYNGNPSPTTQSFLIAPGGGAGGAIPAANDANAYSGSNGGSGGGGNATGNNYPTTPFVPVTIGLGGSPVTSSVLNQTNNTIVNLSASLSGNSGSAGASAANNSAPGYPYGVGGPGGGARGAGQLNGPGGIGIIIDWVNINPTGNRAGIAGGGGRGINSPGGAQPPSEFPTTGSNGGGHGSGAPGGWPAGSQNAIQYTGAGGGGCSDGSNAGSGATGSMSIRYKTPQTIEDGYGIGGIINLSGSYTIHTFRENGTFTYVYESSPASKTSGSYDIEYLVVAGGGGGGQNLGGGGAGGGYQSGSFNVNLRENYSGVYNVLVGAGGPNNPYTNRPEISPFPTWMGTGYSGSLSSIQTSSLDYIVAYGGGGGGGGSEGAADISGSIDGVNGGGAPYELGLPAGTGSSGFNGGIIGQREAFAGSGGGAGAGQSGGNSTSSSWNGTTFGVGGVGGNGISSSISGLSTYYGGGGGGASYDGQITNPMTQSLGGLGGGGLGGFSRSQINKEPGVDAKYPTAGGANLGGGGGGGIWATTQPVLSSPGGSGVVILRVTGSLPVQTTLYSPTVTVDGEYNIFTFNSSGQIKFI